MVVVTSRGGSSGDTNKGKTNRSASVASSSTAKSSKNIITTVGTKGKAKAKSATSTSNNNTGSNKAITKNQKQQKQESTQSTSNKNKKQKNEEKDKPLPLASKGKKALADKGLSSTAANKAQINVGNKVETMVTSTNGTRIHAQRKFAQAGNVYSGTLNFQAAIGPSSTPTKDHTTPLKRSMDMPASTSKRVAKKPPFSPPPSKKARTEDFITFLCVRGTPSLGPELNYFNFPPVNECEEIRKSTKKKKLSAQICISSQNTETSSYFSVEKERKESKFADDSSATAKETINGTQGTTSGLTESVVGKKNNKKATVDKDDGKSSKPEQKTPSKQSLDKSSKKKNEDVNATASGSGSLKKLATASGGAINNNKADNPTKGIRATASSIMSSKIKTSSLPATSVSSKGNNKIRPILSPTRSKINEQEARFAMTALKFKYQRMANRTTQRSLLLTKKAKGRSSILTRSKAMSVTSPKNKFVVKKGKIPVRPTKSAVISPSRNAPSPDIIFGVRSTSSAVSKRAKSPSSGSESEQDKASSSESESESKESEEDEDEKPTSSVQVRSLRNGKELVRPKSPVKEKTVKKKEKETASVSVEEGRRVGTRSAQRITKSPLRELPMYSENKPKKVKKLSKTKKDLNEKKSKNTKSKDREVDEDDEDEDEGNQKGRSTRRTNKNKGKEVEEDDENDEEEKNQKGRSTRRSNKNKSKEVEDDEDDEENQKGHSTRRTNKNKGRESEEDDDEEKERNQNERSTRRNNKNKSKEVEEDDNDEDSEEEERNQKERSTRRNNKNKSKEVEEDDNDEDSEEEERNQKERLTRRNNKNKSKEVEEDDNDEDSEEEERNQKERSTRRTKKPEKEASEKRPSRKTKEKAALYLGLLATGFSTDDSEGSEIKDEGGDEDSEIGSSSSSETKFLEKRYHASLKRNNQSSKVEKRKAKSDVEKRSRKETTKKVDKKKDSEKEVKKSENSKKGKTEEEKQKPRTLRSQRGRSNEVQKSEDNKESKKAKEEKSSSSIKTRRQKSPEPTRKRNTTPTVGDRKMPGAARKSATIVYRRRSRYDTSSEEEQSSSERSSFNEDQEEDEKSEDEEVSDNDASEDEKSESSEKRKSPKLPDKSRGKKIPAKPVVGKKGKIPVKQRSNYSDKSDEKSESEAEDIEEASPPDERRNNSKEDSASIACEMRKLVEQKRAVVEASSQESRPSSTLSSKSGGSSSSKKVESIMTEECRMSLERSRSPSVHSQIASSNSSSSSAAEEQESSQLSSSCEESDDDEVKGPLKVTIAIQVDMDAEEGITDNPSMTTLDDQEQVINEIPPAATQIKDDSDDDVQEIGQVFASSSASTASMHRHRQQFTTRDQHHYNLINDHNTNNLGSSQIGDGISSASPASSTASPSMGYYLPQHHQDQHNIFQQQQQPQLSSLHNNPFSPFATTTTSRASHQEFYTPLQLTPNPLVHHSSIHLVGSGLGGSSFPVSSPLNTLSIPVPVNHLSGLSSHLLSHGPTLQGFTTGSTFHSATTLQQTHIRSVASNISLVRPVIGSDPSLGFMNAGRGHSMGMTNAMNNAAAAAAASLTRPPMGMWHQPQHQQQQSHHQMDPSRSHYSAFRVPMPATSQQTVIHHQSTTVLGMNTPLLPVSIVQPQQHHQPQQFHQPMQQRGSSHSSRQEPSHSGTSSNHRTNSHGQYKTSAGSDSSSSKSATLSHSNSNNASTVTPPGYNIIKNLPNVSIVPKFDRNSKPQTQLPSQEPGSSSSSSKKGNNKSNVKGSNHNADGGNGSQPVGEKKERGRKKKQNMILPRPSSPLTVRKDSNPATYIGISAKKQQKKDSSSTSVESHSSKNENPENSDKFAKLLKMKKGNKEDKTKSPGPSQKEEKEKGPSSSKQGNDSRSKSPAAAASVSSPTHKVKEEEVGANGIREAPTYYPTDQEFDDPLKYIHKVFLEAEQFGIARIVPPRSFRPECNVQDDMRFTAYNHYIHKMYQRWGSNVLESQSIKEKVKDSEVNIVDAPIIGGMEINLSDLFQTVMSFGGLTEVLAKGLWTKVADTMHVPKAAHDRATKLDAIYVKYVLPYESLSAGEREELKKEVEKSWMKRREKMLKTQDESNKNDSADEVDECVVKGKTIPLKTYYRVATNTLNIFFPPENEYTTDEIEKEYWKIVRDRNRHVCVYSGSIDCTGVGWGFPMPKASNRHPWNLKVLANNQGSILRSMGPVMGTTVPTLHVSMLFTTYCWYRDPQGLPWVEYLHSEANKVWYSVPAAHEYKFRDAMAELMPMQCKKKKIWLACDSAMVPPDLLIAKGVPLVRAVQKPGEFLVVFPKSYTSAICTGYLISESVCFAFPSYLQTCLQTFKDIRDSKEPPVFPLEKLILNILQDARASLEHVRMAIPPAKEIVKEEIALRKKLKSLGVKNGGKMLTDSSSESKSSSKKKSAAQEEEELETCDICSYLLYLSMAIITKKTKGSKDSGTKTMCLKHAVEHCTRYKKDIKETLLYFDFDEDQLEGIVENASMRCGNRKSTD